MRLLLTKINDLENSVGTLKTKLCDMEKKLPETPEEPREILTGGADGPPAHETLTGNDTPDTPPARDTLTGADQRDTPLQPTSTLTPFSELSPGDVTRTKRLGWTLKALKKLPRKVELFVLTDSLVRGVNAKNIDPGQRVNVRSCGGLCLVSLVQGLKYCKSVCPQILHVLYSVGVNDVLHAAEHKDERKTLLRSLEKESRRIFPHARIGFVLPPPGLDRVTPGDVHTLAEDITKSGVNFCLFQPPSMDGKLQEDNLHPNAEGNELLTQYYKSITVPKLTTMPKTTKSNNRHNSPGGRKLPSAPTQQPGAPTQIPSAPTQQPGGPSQSPGGITQRPSDPTQPPRYLYSDLPRDTSNSVSATTSEFVQKADRDTSNTNFRVHPGYPYMPPPYHPADVMMRNYYLSMYTGQRHMMPPGFHPSQITPY